MVPMTGILVASVSCKSGGAHGARRSSRISADFGGFRSARTLIFFIQIMGIREANAEKTSILGSRTLRRMNPVFICQLS